MKNTLKFFGIIALIVTFGFSLIACDTLFGGNNSDQTSDENNNGNNPTPTIPGIPSGIVATAQSSSSINIKWNSVTGATSYDIYYRLSTESTSTRRFVGTSSGTSYTHSGLDWNTTYYYYLKAKNSAGESADSSYTTVSAITNQVKITGLSSKEISSGTSTRTILITWDLVPDAASYEIQVKIGSSVTWQALGTRPGTNPAYTHQGASYDKLNYRVRAISNTGIISAWSN